MKAKGWIYWGMGGLLIWIAGAMTGCAPTLPPVARPDSSGTSVPVGSPAESVKALAADMAEARTAQLDLLSPDWFSQAEKAFETAQTELANGRSAADIQEAVIIAHGHLRKAEVVAMTSRHTLAPVLKARELARRAGAAANEKAYQAVEADCLDLARAIEQDNLADAEKNRGKVIEAYRKLEIEATRTAALGPAQARIAADKEAGARRLAPQTYAEAIDAIEATDAFITANPRASAEIQNRADHALFQANRVAAIADSSKRFKSLDPEAAALLLETYLHTITMQLGAPDMRDEQTQTQLENIIGTIDALKNDRGFLSQQNQTLQSDVADLQARLDDMNMKMAMLESKSRQDQMAKEQMTRERMAAEQRLAAEQKIAQLLTTVKGYFSSREADINQEAGQVMIRLKAMRFAVGKSTIMPENYPLLSKVQKAIRTFEASRVTVEGHTDASGSVETNMRLSQQRADAVRNYLINNQTLPAESITAIGYGSARPLAPNTTEKGRAINRRIDIVITPLSKPI